MKYRNAIVAFLVITGLLFIVMNKSAKRDYTLPVLGPYDIVESQKNFHPVSAFTLYDQMGDTITGANFEDKIRVVDFFFTSCPTICPKVQAQMQRIYDAFPNEPSLKFISHSIDTKHDTIARLAEYAQGLGIENNERWHFLTGEKDEIFGLADDYFNIVVEDESAPGGLDHSGRIVLVDKKGYIRSFANGSDPKAVDLLIKNIGILLKSYESEAQQ